jgi:hypothetical protein
VCPIANGDKGDGNLATLGTVKRAINPGAAEQLG